jgi:two-component system response regulator
MSAKRTSPYTILLADDDPDDRVLTSDAIQEIGIKSELRFVENGEELVAYLQRKDKYSDPKDSPKPSLILLDLHMPKMDGREALKIIKSNPDFKRIPVVVLTTSQAEEDIFRTYELGVNSFITKPVAFESMVEIMKTLSKYWFEIVSLPKED